MTSRRRRPLAAVKVVTGWTKGYTDDDLEMAVAVLENDFSSRDIARLLFATRNDAIERCAALYDYEADAYHGDMLPCQVAEEIRALKDGAR